MGKAYDCLKDKAIVISLLTTVLFVDPDTGAHPQRIENTWWGAESNEVCFVQELPKSLPKLPTGMVVAYPFGIIIKHIADLSEVRKDA